MKTDLLECRRTKITATIGPASSDPAVIGRLVDVGADVFRLNMSHGDHAAHRAANERIRAAAEEWERPVAVLVDLCGPKIRLGRLEGGRVEVAEAAVVVVTTRDVVGGPGLLPCRYRALGRDVKSGARVLIADGSIELTVEQVDGSEIRCRVVRGGTVKDGAGINLPGVPVSAPALTDKDRADARFALDLGADLLALSFVRRSDDLEELRSLLPPAPGGPKIIAKVERPEALEEIGAIIDASDGIMVARGDLGVELPPEVVPVVQRQLVGDARARGKPSIVATQMLESMVEHPQPTRAEVSDVSTAVFAGADSVMLSTETALGRCPVEAVAMMDRIAREVESHLWAEQHFELDLVGPMLTPIHQAMARSTAQLSRDLGIGAVVSFTTSGGTAEALSAARPAAPVLALSSDPRIVRQMSLLWGVVPVHVREADLHDPHALARRLAAERGLAGKGDYLLAIAGLGGRAVEPSITVIRM